ncbi:MAG TPA: glycine cleavage system aminomethyltransferase GcvT [Steroidobacteraceae bacterium]
MGLKTPLYDTHVAAGARMVDFGGWDMPVNYGSQIEEHHAVRQDAGIFDVSHMCVIDARGPRVREFFSRLIANDVARLKQPGKALYSCMLNERGGVIDDLIVYFLDDTFFRVVVNAGTRDKDLAWMRAIAPQFGVQLTERIDLAMVAVQGPNARERVASLLPAEHRAAALALEPFFGKTFAVNGGEWFVARTGYTGEDGFEIMLPAAEAPAVWNRLNELGVKSAGLGARDTLRLEAAMNLYGNDMDESQNPLESGLAWTVSFENPSRDFIGRKALEELKAAGLQKKFVALLLEDRGVLRGHQKVVSDAGEGEITSGTFSPTLQKSIALARVPKATGDRVQVDVRGKLLNARVVKAPFVRNGRILVS